MKSIYNIYESILDDIDAQMANGEKDVVNELLVDWINNNWLIDRGELTIKLEGSTYVVDCSGSVRHPRTGKITNGLFVWGNIAGDFVYNVIDTETQKKTKSLSELGLPRTVGGELNLHSFNNVTNLEGLPDNVGSLHISGFKKLSSLKGCPTNVENKFTILLCPALKGLDYLPNHIGGGITINHNKNLLSIDGLSAVTNVVNGNLFLNGNYSLKSLEGCPSTVNGVFSIEKCKALTSLSGFPEYVDSHIYCKNCGTRFTQDQIRAICGQRIGYKIDAYKD